MKYNLSEICKCKSVDEIATMFSLRTATCLGRGVVTPFVYRTTSISIVVVAANVSS